ncbi:MAG: Ig domain-containing protein [Ruminococcaceae bacterium]|jgi:hypothetical protein|nr:Ig domain-containing protein [Oscillospiraceae bacterium]
MKLVKCPICGEMYSDSYKACPFCAESGPYEGTVKRRKVPGRRVETRRGPNILGPAMVVVLLLLVAFLVYTFFGDRIREAIHKGDNEEVQPPVVTQISLEPAEMELAVGEIRLLTASGADSFVWSSSSDAVATVDELGNVTAVGVGSAVITAAEAGGNKLAQCVVTVQEPTVPDDGNTEPGNEQTPDDGNTEPGNEQTPNDNQEPDDNNEESTPPDTVLVIGAVESGRTALPTVTVGGETMYDVTLKAGAPSVHLIIIGTDSEATWTSSSPAAVAVTSNGTITRLDVGTAIITVEVDGQVLKCRVLE